MKKKFVLKFWKKKIDLLNWQKKPKKVINLKKSNKNEWYPDGKLNLSLECIDYNIEKGLGNKTALIFLDNDEQIITLTYKQLLNCIERFSFILKKLKIKNNKILIHASASFESAVSMLSCARLGISHSVVFQDLQFEAMNKRIKLFKPDIIITRDSDTEIKKKFTSKNKNLQKKLVIFRKNKTKLNLKFFDSNKICYDEKLEKYKNKISFKSNRKLFTLFTSGSTGEPKGIMHSTGGYLTYAKYTCSNFFGINKNSVVLTASDAGWINGHTYALYGPLSLGATSILLESPMLILNRFVLEKFIYKYSVSVLYLPVTLIRIFRSINKNKKFKNHKIKTLGSMGEPLAPDVANWFANIFDHKNSIVNTYFQTETGGVITAPKFNDLPKNTPHGSVGKPKNIYGLRLVNKNKNNQGEVILREPWPGCMTDVINGPKVWSKYWTEKGFFKLFDIGSFDKQRSLNIHGRNDDVINIRGHRLGSEEVESTVLKIKEIVECACISIPEKLEGFNLILFVVLDRSNSNIKLINKSINAKIINNFGTFALPKKIYFVDSLPKTRSGKILRRILRDIIQDPNKKNYGDLSTIFDFNVINLIKKKILNEK